MLDIVNNSFKERDTGHSKITIGQHRSSLERHYALAQQYATKKSLKF